MINLYCNFNGSKRKVIRSFKKQQACSHIISSNEFMFGKPNVSNEITGFLNVYAQNFGYNTKILDGYLINCDFFMPDAPDVLKSILAREYTLAKSRYLLVQTYRRPSFFEELVLEMGRLGIVMVELHHLKHQMYNETLGLLHMLDADDIIGKNGKDAQNAAFYMIEDGTVTFVGGNNINAAYIKVKQFNSIIADNLFLKNPSKVILDECIY